MQAATPPSSRNTTLWFGLPIRGVRNSLQFLQSQFDLEGRAPFDAGRILEIRIGRETTEVDTNNFSEYLRNRRFVPQWDGVIITADRVAWKSAWESIVQGRLPQAVATVVTVFDEDKRFQQTTLQYNDHDFPPLTLSFASIPVDKLHTSDAADMFALPNLQTLILLPPKSPSALRVYIEDITRKLVTSLPRMPLLRKVQLTLDFSTGVKDIIEALKDIPSLKELELTKPTSFDIFDLEWSRRIELDNALLRSLEPFPGLETLVLDDSLLSLPLIDMGGRMFEEKITTDNSIVFRAPLPLLFQGNSLVFW